MTQPPFPPNPPQQPAQQPGQQPGQPRQLRLEIPANLTADYANAVIISHTHSEIIIDFVQMMPNDPRARVLRRIAMTPANAKLFLQALGTNLERFEEKHGEIKLPPRPVSLADQLFGSIRPDDGTDGSTDSSSDGSI